MDAGERKESFRTRAMDRKVVALYPPLDQLIERLRTADAVSGGGESGGAARGADHLERFHPRPFRPLLQPLDEALECRVLAAGKNLHPSVGEISCIPRDPEFLCGAACECAIAHALHLAARQHQAAHRVSVLAWQR